MGIFCHIFNISLFLFIYILNKTLLIIVWLLLFIVHNMKNNHISQNININVFLDQKEHISCLLLIDHICHVLHVSDGNSVLFYSSQRTLFLMNSSHRCSLVLLLWLLSWFSSLLCCPTSTCR